MDRRNRQRNVDVQKGLPPKQNPSVVRPEIRPEKNPVLGLKNDSSIDRPDSRVSRGLAKR